MTRFMRLMAAAVVVAGLCFAAGCGKANKPASGDEQKAFGGDPNHIPPNVQKMIQDQQAAAAAKGQQMGQSRR